MFGLGLSDYRRQETEFGPGLTFLEESLRAREGSGLFLRDYYARAKQVLRAESWCRAELLTGGVAQGGV